MQEEEEDKCNIVFHITGDNDLQVNFIFKKQTKRW